MKHPLFLILFLITATVSGQKIFAKLVTTQNDTINVTLKINLWSRDVQSFQEKVVVIENDGTKKEYLPKDLKSYKVKYNDKIIEYESVDGKIFAELMYSNRLKLLKFIKFSYNASVNYYIIEKPNNGKTIYMEAIGLSRLISKKTILREISDCPATINKVETNELKINGENGVIELVKDYEKNCF